MVSFEFGEVSVENNSVEKGQSFEWRFFAEEVVLYLERGYLYSLLSCMGIEDCPQPVSRVTQSFATKYEFT